ncbi:hypothetical protein F5Y08DRAFT_70077 [Xylaria arbuscula]|nr:hypothetical protein F5Y08DRAFT_70077 [Xylaria arbuscula]
MSSCSSSHLFLASLLASFLCWREAASLGYSSSSSSNSKSGSAGWELPPRWIRAACRARPASRDEEGGEGCRSGMVVVVVVVVEDGDGEDATTGSFTVSAYVLG